MVEGRGQRGEEEEVEVVWGFETCLIKYEVERAGGCEMKVWIGDIGGMMYRVMGGGV